MHERTHTLDLFRLDGRCAVVTGAGRGLGRQFARALAEAGAHVVCADLDGNAAEKAALELRQAGAQATFAMVDVGDEASVSEMAHDLEREGLAVEILINNAGIVQDFSRVHELAVDSFDQVIRINLRGSFLCMQAFLPGMMARRRGSIINISSIVGLRGWVPDHLPQAHYAASKAGVEGLTRQAAVEYGKYNIRINTIAPGLHEGTELGADSVAKMQVEHPELLLREAVERLTLHVPLQRWAGPAELRGLALFLVSDAGAYMTGQTIAHDGGYTAF